MENITNKRTLKQELEIAEKAGGLSISEHRSRRDFTEKRNEGLTLQAQLDNYLVKLEAEYIEAHRKFEKGDTVSIFSASSKVLRMGIVYGFKVNEHGLLYALLKGVNKDGTPSRTVRYSELQYRLTKVE